VEGFGEIDVRLFKGFSLELFARGSRRRDQLSLRRGSATVEEILVRQRELATGYEYEIGFGFKLLVRIHLQQRGQPAFQKRQRFLNVPAPPWWPLSGGGHN
jgi:hypothetical protein